MGKDDNFVKQQLDEIEKKLSPTYKAVPTDENNQSTASNPQVSSDDFRPFPEHVKLKISNKLNRFKEIAAKNTSTIQGHIQFMSFAAIKDALDDQWDRFRISIYEKVDEILDSILSDKDVYLRTSDYFYLVAFDSLDLQAALTKLDIARDKIMTHYFGSDYGENSTVTKNFSIKASSQIIDSSIFLKDLDLVANMGQKQKAQDGCSFIADLKSAGANFSDALKLKYQPFWDTKFEVIVGYQPYLKAIPEGHNCRYPLPYFDTKKCKEDRQNIDIETLKEVLEVINELRLNKFVFLCNCPISMSTANDNHQFAKIIELCKNQHHEIQNLLNIELIEYPAGFPSSKLIKTVRAISPYCHDVILNTTLEDLRFYELAKDANINVVSVDIDRRQETMAIEKLSHTLNIFCSKLRKAKIDLALNGVNQLEAAIVARRRGVRYISGSLVGSTTEYPEHMSRFKWTEIKDSNSA